MTQVLVAFGRHVQIIDIARLGKVGGIQKVATKLLGHMRVVLGKMLGRLDGALIKVGHIHIGNLRLDLDRSHQQNARAGDMCHLDTNLNGIRALPMLLEAHKPLDAIVIMLGTND